jgi:hypothetical protein
VAYTRAPDGRARIYINGKEAAAADIRGDLSGWDPQFRLALGDEFAGDRAWLGTYHGLAVYNRALSAAEIADHAGAGAPMHRQGLQVHYAFTEGDGAVVRDQAGLNPALHLDIRDPSAVTWVDDGLRLDGVTLIATRDPAQRLAAAVRDTNAFTLEAWITPAATTQSGPARIATLSRDHGVRNFTLGQDGNAYEMRLRTTATSANGLPALSTTRPTDASIAATRSPDGHRAAVFVSRGSPIRIDRSKLQPDRKAAWFDPRTATRQTATPREDGSFLPPSQDIWLLVLQ